jgi:hypothetical protein
VNVRFRPISNWPAEFSRRKSQDRFGATTGQTLQLLDYELGKLGATDVVVEAGFREADIRLDGWPRANARVPEFSGVIVSFESKHGPLRYGTDAFPTWQSNLRAIALGLEALRKVDRYGIGKRGEQYVGWKALPAGGTTRGRDLIREHGGVTAALKATHPDRGGDADDFQAVMAARDA